MNAWMGQPPPGWQEVVERALTEDIGTGDVTSSFLPWGQQASWLIESQSKGVLCGVGIAQWLFSAEAAQTDGSAIRIGSNVISGRSDLNTLLVRERVALNFLMHLSGVATLTDRFVEATRGTKARIVDTRKTTPGLRQLEKYAVRCGGGHNHRMGLFDGILIKDNHIEALGGIKSAIALARQNASHLLQIEIECQNIDQVADACESNAAVILLDNMDIETLREAVKLVDGRAILEASGGVTLDTVSEIAACGVNLISVGQITHSAPAHPFHLELA